MLFSAEINATRLSAQNPNWPSNYNLHNAPHIIREADILKNYDSITPDYKDGRRGIVYVKNYGGVEYRYAAYISKAHRRSKEPQGVHLITGWITKKASGQAFHPTSFSKNFTRTEIVNPISEYIKQNYAEEAKKQPEQDGTYLFTLGLTIESPSEIGSSTLSQRGRARLTPQI